MEELTLLETIDWAQDPFNTCAGQPIIPAYNWEDLARDVQSYPEVIKDFDEVLSWLEDQSLRFAACGANLAERYAVVRKNPKTGWTYMVDFLTKKESE